MTKGGEGGGGGGGGGWEKGAATGNGSIADAFNATDNILNSFDIIYTFNYYSDSMWYLPFITAISIPIQYSRIQFNSKH